MRMDVASRLAVVVAEIERAGVPVSDYLEPGYIRSAGLAARLGECKTQAHFFRVLWSAVQGLYAGEIGEFQFIDTFVVTIREQLTKAWKEGMHEAGVEIDAATPEDWQELDRIILNEHDYILNLGSDIIADRTAVKPLGLNYFRARVELWANRYTETVNNAVIWFGKKLKFEWKLGNTEEHCETCAELDGIVAWAQEWEESKIRPQNPPNPLLSCGGWRCDCTLTQTDKRRTRGALNRLIDIAASRFIG